MKSWRDVAAPIIARLIAEHGHDGKGLKKALFDAYPFGERRYYPYKIWLDEIKRQRGLKRPIRGYDIEKAGQQRLIP